MPIAGLVNHNSSVSIN